MQLDFLILNHGIAIYLVDSEQLGLVENQILSTLANCTTGFFKYWKIQQFEFDLYTLHYQLLISLYYFLFWAMRETVSNQGNLHY